ncbi:S9 family peptidase [Sphingomonas sp. CFBP 13720]|uniref:S9 family peptidase n=1 Tax=Sphingomonas sp. CFBP 13720 TaxID=2775302 RepID=UPI001784566C|nr:DPP IV N-terminal domain-containing protein [Sphingomonas sp. CFBP 13720]MBD8677575.1 S9 family peptidase [Sphingomonas sp. CFBP 13720]
MVKWWMGVALLALGQAGMAAEPAKPGDLTLERVFASPDLNGTQPQSLRLSPDGRFVTLLRNRADERERFDLWAMDTTSGEWRMLVDSKKVGTGAALSEAEKMQRERDRSLTGKRGILNYDWSPDGKSILVPLDGDLYLATIDGSVRRLTQSESGELNPVVSPAGGYVSFVRDQNLIALDLKSGRETALTTEGRDTVHFGEAEFVAQEEMSRRTGYWWSPGDRMVAVERFDEAPVGIVTRSAIGAEGTTVYQQRYPKAGTANVLVDLYVMRADGSGRVKVDLGSNSDIYLARVDWLPDGSALLVQRQNRAQTQLDMLRVDPATGRSTVLFSERSGEKSWVNLSDAYHAMKDGSLIWWSERDGQGHLYHWKAGKWTQLTKGPWAVGDLAGVDEGKGRVYFLGNKDDPLERQLYRVDLAKPGAVTRLTEAGWSYGASMDAKATRLIVSRSSPDQPPQTFLADTAGKRIAWINQNALTGDHPYAPFVASHRPTKFGTIKAQDGSTLHWNMITPAIEPGKRYPVFFSHYGGPHNQVVRRAWGGALRQYLVDRGWIWFEIDNRGSPDRGKAFEDQIYHAMGSVEVEDQLAGAAFLKTQSFVDPARIATYGWSYGGYMTLKLLEKAPGVFAAGIAGAPVSRWELYDTHYTERYMGDPSIVPDAYAASATVADAAKIADPLLLIHGMADDNVVLEHSTAMMAAMQKSATPFELMLYPGQTHRVGGPGVSEHLWKTILDFLDRQVPAK